VRRIGAHVDVEWGPEYVVRSIVRAFVRSFVRVRVRSFVGWVIVSCVARGARTSSSATQSESEDGALCASLRVVGWLIGWMRTAPPLLS
jgi:hypothetical protein